MLGEPRSLGSGVAASQNSRVSVYPPLPLPSIRQRREEEGLEEGSNHGFSPQVAT